ncbi:gluconokinase [Lederbergia lenta]|uniref:Carbohydrate kinase n=1 Tax=Lederbergia lenta TaxID=1467 RepID=A0A2X4WJU0_LEDLE|nr:gluconokinase [Lederbergia lenta]MEC2323407.1 gluconokinase [Lederbergia lenta]SQI63361.1 carbohydrate kinase [Lederbergia lenta]
MSQEFVIGLDIGTTSVKAIVFDMGGKVKAETEQLTKTYHPQQGWQEQDPDELERCAVQAVKMVMKKVDVQKEAIVGIGLSCAMHSLICVADDGTPLSRALIWSDGRSSAQAEKLLKTDGDELFRRTGVPIHPMSPLVKLLWMKETNYEPYHRARYFMSIKDYILMKWYGKVVADYSIAASSGLMNAETLQWDEKALELVNVKPEQLPEIVPPTEVLLGLNRDLAAELGILSETPVIVGAADGQLANLGIGAIVPGEVAITVGTSGAIRQFANGFRINDRRETFCYAFTKEYSIIGGATNNGGIALQWLKELVKYEGSYEDFLRQAEDVTPGAEGMIFLPYINGERAPIWNQQATGNFSGVAITHKQEHFVRAVFEGITFNLYQIEQALERLAGKTETIYVNGGLARSPLWLQLLADIFGKEVYVAETHHSSAWGAAWTALVAIGKVNSFEEIKHSVKLSSAIIPNEENHRIYQGIYKKYTALVEDISIHF